MDPSGKYCYAINSKKYASFHDAEKACYNYGGYSLAKIPTAIDNSFVWNLIRSSGSQFYIGLSDFSSDGSFRWLDGSSLSYSNWASNSGAIPGDCVIIDGNTGKWKQTPCNLQYQFICYGQAPNAPTDIPTLFPPTTPPKPIREETEGLFFMIDAESLGNPNTNQDAYNFYVRERDFVMQIIQAIITYPNAPNAQTNCSYLTNYAFYGYGDSQMNFDHAFPYNLQQFLNSIQEVTWDHTTTLNYNISDAIIGSKTFEWQPSIKDFGYSTLVFLTASQNPPIVPSFDYPAPNFDDVIVVTLANSPFTTMYPKLQISGDFSQNDVTTVLQKLQCH
ncbi:unnamed protein product [Caenorhabditis angaria]|uniref:C-type lectin domain-containing protein n=1 Tax=Caenorhabditis angaria TaxID=860376 RepID=A0A9P1IJF7_9PELO|nr:unnamed protein product [Caenorhabditis angaria]